MYMIFGGMINTFVSKSGAKYISNLDFSRIEDADEEE
jgi:hypothetical protein